MEARPDPFIRYDYPKLLDKSREAIANLLSVPVSTIVFVPNATTGVNTVLRNLVWTPDGADEILYFNTIYGACGKSVGYTCEASLNLVHARRIDLVYPISDSCLLRKFQDAISASRTAGRRPRLAIFDIISSLPGLRMPFESLTAICATEGILSLIDGAHGIGHIPLSLSALNPDFFVSNAHKWLHVPRGCAVFYVPLRNQALIRSTLPTSHGFVPLDAEEGGYSNPLPASAKGEFVNNFEFVGTLDNSPYLCVPEALRWRREVCGGEDAIYFYCQTLVRHGSRHVADVLGTEVLDNEDGTLTRCCMANVRLPLMTAEEAIPAPAGLYAVPSAHVTTATTWLLETLMSQFNTFLAIFRFQGSWYVRLCGQVYLEMEDFEWTAKVLKGLCERVGRGEYLVLTGGRKEEREAMGPEGKKVDAGGKRVVEGGDLARDGVGANA
jgi:selenocysteine lyase/cysteine desulfurase